MSVNASTMLLSPHSSNHFSQQHMYFLLQSPRHQLCGCGGGGGGGGGGGASSRSDDNSDRDNAKLPPRDDMILISGSHVHVCRFI
jgi:hypothetical protein